LTAFENFLNQNVLNSNVIKSVSTAKTKHTAQFDMFPAKN
jgi:hypothetical protein